MENEVFIAKLTTGETLLFRGYVEENGGLVATDMPMSLFITPQGISFMEWVIGVEHNDEFKIYFDMKHVLFFSKDVKSELKNPYLEKVTGVSLAPATAQENKIII